jgi:hypothetical protein
LLTCKRQDQKNVLLNKFERRSMETAVDAGAAAVAYLARPFRTVVCPPTPSKWRGTSPSDSVGWQLGAQE